MILRVTNEEELEKHCFFAHAGLTKHFPKK
jgi:hypothetical protein